MKKNLHEFIRKNTELAVTDFQMIQPRDRIMVGISGGADSFVLLKMLSGRKIFTPKDISLIAVHIDLGFYGENPPYYDQLKAFFETNGYEYHIEKTKIGTYAHSEKNRKKPCFLCSRFRRQRMIELADRFKCQKIALGHHKDDVIETLMINILFGRQISTMIPNQELFKGKFHIIRPLVYIWEKKIKQYAQQNDFPTFENPCPSAKTSKRLYIKYLLQNIERDHKGIRENIFRSLRHVKKDYLWNR
jgi:tRNA 2-thiocytidine biosynthesis protein TtcA